MAVNSFNAQNPPVNTKGDLFTFSTVPTKLGVGANNTVLTADSTTATGLKWAASSAWSPNLTLLNSGGTALTGATTITVNVSSYDMYHIYFTGASSANTGPVISITMNGDTGSNYYYTRLYSNAGTVDSDDFSTNSRFQIGRISDSNQANSIYGHATIIGGKNTGIKWFTSNTWANPDASGTAISGTALGFYSGSSAVTSISIVSSTGNFDAGTIYVYGG